jgi:hypothetical protein
MAATAETATNQAGGTRVVVEASVAPFMDAMFREARVAARTEWVTADFQRAPGDAILRPPRCEVKQFWLTLTGLRAARKLSPLSSPKSHPAENRSHLVGHGCARWFRTRRRYRVARGRLGRLGSEAVVETDRVADNRRREPVAWIADGIVGHLITCRGSPQVDNAPDLASYARLPPPWLKDSRPRPTALSFA